MYVDTSRRSTNLAVGAGLAAVIAALALATGYIHSTLGGLLFTLNALGYAGLAALYILGAWAPLPIVQRFSWFPRVALAGYALLTIIGWAIQGPYYSTAYLAKGIEVALIVLLAIDFVRMDGNPVTVIRRELSSLVALVTRRSGQAGAAA